MIFLTAICLLISTSYADVGRVISVHKGASAFIIRNGEKKAATVDSLIQAGDQIETKSSLIIILLNPSTQISLNSKTKMIIKRESVDLIYGFFRIQFMEKKDKKINRKIVTDGVSFSAENSEFEVTLFDKYVDLDVFSGEVEVTSPHVHTFVPEIVKPKQGFRYAKKLKQFIQRDFKPKFTNHPGFKSLD